VRRLLIIGATVVALSATATIALAGTEPANDVGTDVLVQMHGQDIDPVIASIMERLRSVRHWHTDHASDRAHDAIHDRSIDATLHTDQMRDQTMDITHDTDQAMDQMRDQTMDITHDTDQVTDQVHGNDGIVDDQDMGSMGSTDSMGNMGGRGGSDH